MVRRVKRYCALGLLVALAGCGDLAEEPALPSNPGYPVAYVLDLMTEGYALREPFTMMTIQEPRHPGDRLGVAGLLVVHTHLTGEETEAYGAFDLACPNEWPAVVAVEPRGEGTMEVVCPKCGTVYDLTFGAGLPKTGTGRYPLWQYRTTLRGTILEITNSIGP